MSCFLLVGTKADGFQHYAEMLSNDYQIETTLLESGKQALQLIMHQQYALVIVGKTPDGHLNTEFIGSLVQNCPMQCCAAVSGLSPDEFHEATEGLGVLAQLPVYPTREAIDALLDHLLKIQRISV
jgi:hypothetical protein